MSASKVFKDRFKSVPQNALEQLDRLQQQYGSTGPEMLNAWEALTLSNSDWAGMSHPSDESSLGAFRRELEAAAARRKKSREVLPVSNVKTPFNMNTPPPQKKRSSEISPPTDAKRQLTMDQLSSVPSFSSPSLVAREFKHMTDVPEIQPLNAWTSRWMARNSKDNYLYMHSTVESISEKLREELAAFGENALAAKMIKYPALRGEAAADPNADVPEFATGFDKVGATAQGRNVLVCGRIVCDSENGKLNAKSLMLEGINGIRVKLDMDGYKDGKVSLFPGQYVIVEGLTLGSTRIRAEKVYFGEIQPPPCSAEGARDFKFWVASGPYTGGSDLKFEYLDTLLAQVSRENPDYLMLLGPFVDANHPMIASGRPSVQVTDARGTVQTITDLGFEDILGFFLQRILTGLKEAKTKVLLVPCTDDIVHPIMAFPQSNLEIPVDLDDERFISLPNPASFSIGGVSFGVANIDTLFDFQEEGSAALGYEPRENMTRLASHVLFQRSYYPIVPPSPESAVDIAAREHFALPPVDVLLMPSKLQSFAQDIGSVLCVNPGKSVTMKTKMTVTRMEFRASSEITEDEFGTRRGTNVAKTRTKVDFSVVG